MKKIPTRRQRPEVNTGSMADIAFLLLIFFLVTTTIVSDSGLLVRLPIWVPEPPNQSVLKRNILSVSINADDELLVLGEVLPVTLLKERVKDFILNPQKRNNLSTRPDAAVISLIHDRSTSYAAYLSVYDELKTAYSELWEKEASARFGQHYTALNKIEQKSIRKKIPLVISEAEPTDYALNH